MSRAHEIMVTIIGMEGGTMLNMNPAIGWLVLIIILLVIEIATLGLTTIGSCDSVDAFSCSVFGISVTDQTHGSALHEEQSGKHQCRQSGRKDGSGK